MVVSKLIKYSAIIIVFASLFAESVHGQRWRLRRYEVGGGIGMTQVFGDIGGTLESENWYGLKDIKLDETSLVVPIYARYKIDPRYSVKANLALGFGHGEDAGSRNDRGRSYKTRLLEFSAQGEYYFLSEDTRRTSAAMFNKRGMINNYMSFSAYGFLGVGGTYSNATVNFTQEQFPKDDIRASNIGVVFPFGVGIKLTLDDRWLVFGELGYRYSITDYIEGYKQTEASKHNDVYYFLSISVGYRLDTSRNGVPGFLDKEYRLSKSKRKNTRSQPRSKREALE